MDRGSLSDQVSFAGEVVAVVEESAPQRGVALPDSSHLFEPVRSQHSDVERGYPGPADRPYGEPEAGRFLHVVDEAARSAERSGPAEVSQGALCLCAMEAAVTGLEAEEQLVRFGTALGMNADTTAVSHRSPPPQGYVGPAQDPQILEERRRIVGRVIEPGYP